MKKYFEFYNPVKIIAGFKALSNLPFELNLLNVKSPLILTDFGVKKAGLLEKVLKSLYNTDIKPCDIIDKIPHDSSVETVNEISESFRKSGCDSLIAIGGGSVIDTAKGVNILISLDDNDLKKYEGAEIIDRELKPLIVIPTTSGTGSEATYVAVISDPKHNIKLAFTSYFLLPNLALIDPEMTLTLPPKLTATTSMDAITHAIEAYTSTQNNPLSDAYSLTSIKLINENLIETIKDGNNRERRFNLALASLLAGISFSNSMVGIIHSIAHALGGVMKIPHGLANTIILPFGMEFNFDKAYKRYSEISRYLGIFLPEKSEKENARALIERIFELRENIEKLTGLSLNLKDNNVKKDDFEKIAEKAMVDGSVIFNPKEFNKEDVIKILEKAF